MGKGRGKSVLKHPDKMTIDKMLQTGWSPAKVHNWLISRQKEKVSEKTLLHYRNNYIDSKSILPASVYHTKIKQLDVQIDSLQELYNLIEIQKRRIGHLLITEEQDKTAYPETRKEIELLKDTIIKTVQLEMELGIRDKRPIELIEKRIDITELLKDFMIQKEIMQRAIEP